MSELLKQTEEELLKNGGTEDLAESRPEPSPASETLPEPEISPESPSEPSPASEPLAEPEAEKAAEEPAAAEAEDAVAEKAKKKLEAELAKVSHAAFAKPIIAYLLKRCAEDSGMADDVLQPHKTWDKCFTYIKDKARKLAKNGVAAVEDQTVYEWAEDYYHLDDKAQAEKESAEKAKKAQQGKAEDAPRQKQEKKSKAGQIPKKAPEKAAGKAAKGAEKKSGEKAEQKQPAEKKNQKTMAGQMSLFDLL